MKGLRCKPVVTGDFMQPEMCEKWQKADFDKHFDVLNEAGIDTFVLQWTGEVERGGIKTIHHKSEGLAKDTALHLPEYEEYPDMLGNLLASAKDHKIGVFVGLPMIAGQEWWDRFFVDEKWQDTYCDFTARFAREIYNTYYEEYKEAFAGFYWTQEMYTHNDNWEEDWARMLNKDIEVLNELNPDLPMLMSPFFSAAYRSTPERIEAQYRNMLRLTNFRKGDIMCPQDSYGAFDFSIRYVEEGLAAIARAVEEDGRLRFWVNCENFGNESMRGDNHANDLAPGDISRFVAQLHIAAAYAEKMITFSYSHHYNPNIPSDRHPARAERGRLNHKAYVQYAARFACWDD